MGLKNPVSALYQKILGHPFVYEEIRPRVVGGIDMSGLYALLDPPARRVVLDVGCGTGDALRYLNDFDRYLGIDTDPIAIRAAEKKHGAKSGVGFECRMLERADIETVAPTGVVLSGVLHHLSDTEAIDLLSLIAGSSRLVRVVTSDIVFLPGKHFNNLLARLDRGKYCRVSDGYVELARRAGFEVESGSTMNSSPTNDRVQYFIMSLLPKNARAGRDGASRAA